MTEISTEKRFIPERDASELQSYEVRFPGLVSKVLNELFTKDVILSMYQRDEPDVCWLSNLVDVTEDYVDICVIAEQDQIDGTSDWIVVTFLDDVKLQFQLKFIEQITSDRIMYLRFAVPSQIYRIQRRRAFRVKPLTDQPVSLVCLEGPGMERMHHVIDLSVTGIAFSLSVGAPVIRVGDTFEHARIETGFRAPIPCGFVVRSVGTMIDPVPGSNDKVLRIGAEFVNLPSRVERNLQVYIQDVERALIRSERDADSD